MIKYVFIDMDNTIAENTTCLDVEYKEGIYLNKRPVKQIIEAIETLYKDCTLVILSKAKGGIRGMFEKQAWLEKYFKRVDQVILMHPDERKSEYIKVFMSVNGIEPNMCLLIDDKKEILQDCVTIGIDVKYPLQVLCDYNDLMQNKGN